MIGIPDPDRRAVITGIGVVAPNGIGTEPWWDATVRGESGIREISRFDASRYATRFAGEVPAFEASDYIPRRLAVQTDRWTWMSLAAAEMALADASLDPGARDPYSMSVITASSSGGNEFGQAEIQNLWGRGAGFVGAYQSIAWFYAASTGQTSIRYGMKGPSSVIVSEGAGGLDALAHARRTIRRGTDTIVSGGLEAPLSPYALTCQIGNGKLSSVADPAAYRPFDPGATGYLPGEGGAILLVEDREAAIERATPTIYGEILGYGATNDARRPDENPDARHLVRAIDRALTDAGIDLQDVDAIFADGAGTLGDDLRELEAIRRVFGGLAESIPVTVPKSMVGRLYAGGASLDVAAALLAMRDGVLPPTINLITPPRGVDLVGENSRPANVDVALVVARGHGGFNSALVLGRGDGER